MVATELLVARHGGRLWSALLEDGRVVELRVEDDPHRAAPGAIIRSRVVNVLPGMQSAFLDIGGDRGAFLHASELPVEGADPPSPIERRLREGQDLLVQVTREAVGGKGPRVTARINLAGRLLALVPGLERAPVSRRIGDATERSRLAGLIAGWSGGGFGFIARTAAEGASEEALRDEARRLTAAWNELHAAAATARVPSEVRPAPGLLVESLRDLPREGCRAIVVDDTDAWGRAGDYLRQADPVLAAGLEVHPRPGTLFEERGVVREIDRALNRRVWLRSGGFLVIDETEALVSIDVNTGRFLGKRALEETVATTNLEAVVEVARQIRLRNLGGILVVDLIDIGLEANRERLLATFREALQRDRGRTKVVGLSEVGLLQMTRRRIRRSLYRTLTRPCETCQGSGRIRSGAG